MDEPYAANSAKRLRSTFRAAHVLTFLKHDELERDGKLGDFEEAAEAARTLQDETLGVDDEDGDE